MHNTIRIVAVLLVVAAVVLGALALMLGRRQAVQAPAAAPAASADAAHAYRMVAAAVDLPAGVPLEADQLTLVPSAQPAADGFATPDAAIGAVPLHAIHAGTPLSRSQFARGIASLLMPGERALAIPVDELAGAGNRIVPGDHVDVFLNLRPAAGIGETGAAQSRLLLSRLRVLAYGAMDMPDADTATDRGGTAPPPQAAPQDDRRAQAIRGGASAPDDARAQQVAARSALLAVPVEQANALLLGAQSGKLFLALRHPGDDGVADASLFAAPRPVLAPHAALGTEQRAAALASPENAAFSGLDLDALAGRAPARAQAPARSPAPPAARRGDQRERGIEIIRGDGRSRQAQGY